MFSIASVSRTIDYKAFCLRILAAKKSSAVPAFAFKLNIYTRIDKISTDTFSDSWKTEKQ